MQAAAGNGQLLYSGVGHTLSDMQPSCRLHINRIFKMQIVFFQTQLHVTLITRSLHVTLVTPVCSLHTTVCRTAYAGCSRLHASCRKPACRVPTSLVWTRHSMMISSRQNGRNLQKKTDDWWYSLATHHQYLIAILINITVRQLFLFMNVQNCKTRSLIRVGCEEWELNKQSRLHDHVYRACASRGMALYCPRLLLTLRLTSLHISHGWHLNPRPCDHHSGTTRRQFFLSGATFIHLRWCCCRVSTSPGNLLEYKNLPGNPENLLEFIWSFCVKCGWLTASVSSHRTGYRIACLRNWSPFFTFAMPPFFCLVE